MAIKNDMRDGEDRFYDNDMNDIVELSPEERRCKRQSMPGMSGMVGKAESMQ